MHAVGAPRFDDARPPPPKERQSATPPGHWDALGMRTTGRASRARNVNSVTSSSPKFTFIAPFVKRDGFRIVTNGRRRPTSERRQPLDTPRLARTLDSLVRVSRRVGKRPEDSSQTGNATALTRGRRDHRFAYRPASRPEKYAHSRNVRRPRPTDAHELSRVSCRPTPNGSRRPCQMVGDGNIEPTTRERRRF